MRSRLIVSLGTFGLDFLHDEWRFVFLVTNVDGMDLLGSMTPEFFYLLSMWVLIPQATALQQRMFALRWSFLLSGFGEEMTSGQQVSYLFFGLSHSALFCFSMRL